MTTTTIITRLYPDRRAARAVQKKLLEQKFREADAALISAKEGEDKAALEARLKKAMVHESAASAYADKIMDGATALVVRADYRPLGARRIARAAIEDSKPMSAGAGPEDYTVNLPPEPGHATFFPKVLTDHPLFFRVDGDPGTGREPQTFSQLTGIRPLTDWRPGGQKLAEHGPVLPFKTIDDRPRKKSVMEDHPRFSEDRFGIPTIKER